MVRRRDRDPRPPVEVLGAELPDAPQRVAIGGDRRGARGRGLLLALGVAVLLIGGLALGGEGGEPEASTSRDEREGDAAEATSTTRRPRRTTTTTGSTATTTALPAGPVLPSQTGGALLVVGPGRAATYVELDTGARHEVELASADHWQMHAVRGGVVTHEMNEAYYVALPEGRRVGLGPAEQVLRAGSDDRVWLVTGFGFEGEREPAQRAVLTDLAGRRLTGDVVVRSCCIIGSTDDGVVFSAGGRTYLAHEAGVRPLVEGNVIQVVGDHAMRVECDDGAICETQIVDLRTGRATSLGSTPDASYYGHSMVVAPDGRVAIIVYGPTGAMLIVHGASGREIGRVELRQSAEPAWLPGGHGLVTMGDGLVAQRIFDRDAQLVSEPIGPLDGVLGERIIVIPP